MLQALIVIGWLLIFVLPLILRVRRWLAGEIRLPVIACVWAVLGTILVYGGQWLLGRWVDLLWWREDIGLEPVFWTRLWTELKLFWVAVGVTLPLLLCAEIIAAKVMLSSKMEEFSSARRWARLVTVPLAVIAALITAKVVSESWTTVLLYQHRVPFNVTEPIFGKDASFYVFVMPVLALLRNYLIAIVLLLTALFGAYYAVAGTWLSDYYGHEQAMKRDFLATIHRRAARVGFVVLALLAGLFAFQERFNIWNTMFHDRSLMFGPGYTDVHYVIPTMRMISVLLVASGIMLFVGAFVQRLRPRIILVGLAIALPALTGIIGEGVIAGYVEHNKVGGNKIHYEGEYAKHTIAMTNLGYGLTSDRMEVETFNGDGIPAPLTEQMLSKHLDVMANARLWDWRVLESVFDQTQAPRQYYDYADIDIGRIDVNGQERQVMYALRELNPARLSKQAQSPFIQKLVYTHGFGLTMVPANEVDPQTGSPIYWVENIPPVSSVPGFESIEPRIYFGERTIGRAYAPTKQQELDYPHGDDNVMGHYASDGGVLLGHGLRRLAFALQEDGFRLLVSEDMTDTTRVMWDRDLHTRITRIAPFLKLDWDEYAVPAGGRMYLMVDAYTTTDRFPYADRFRGNENIVESYSEIMHSGGFNYIRDAVKWSLDCYTGDVVGYVFDEDDPIIRAWWGAFPTLFRSWKDMPPELLQHIRYPDDLMFVQASMYSVYHMKDPQVFLSKEDRWEFAHETSSYAQQVSNGLVLPYWVTTRLPGEDNAEFLKVALLTPYTNPNQTKRNNMVAWMAGRCDPEVYGKLKVYLFSKQEAVLGPFMVDNLINQYPAARDDLFKWRQPQSGSQVETGDMLVFPVGNSILYMQSYFLRASSGTGIPQLRRVATATQTAVAWGSTLQQSMSSLVGAEFDASGDLVGFTTEATGSMGAKALSIVADMWYRYIAAERDGRFEEAGAAKAQLAHLIAQLTGTAPTDSAAAQ